MERTRQRSGAPARSKKGNAIKHARRSKKPTQAQALLSRESRSVYSSLHRASVGASRSLQARPAATSASALARNKKAHNSSARRKRVDAEKEKEEDLGKRIIRMILKNFQTVTYFLLDVIRGVPSS